MLKKLNINKVNVVKRTCANAKVNETTPTLYNKYCIQSKPKLNVKLHFIFTEKE